MLINLINRMGFLANLLILASHHLSKIKLVIILVILCKSAHHNNSNYLPFLITLYLYSARTKIDAITLLNYLEISVCYNMLQQKPKNFLFKKIWWIKMQATNPKLVEIWDNFKYYKNVNGKWVDNKIKFTSITLAL